MLRTKQEVDRHVENCLKKINSQAERSQRYFSFARLYFNIGEYEHARRYLSSYLSTKPKSAEGYHLLGKTMEKLGKNEAALEAYRTSLQLDPKQNNLVIKVCELLASDNVNLDQSGARYFCEMAQSFDPQNPAVYSLKERIIVTENKNPTEVSNLLLKELEDRPTDVNLRVRLIKHFLQYNMIREAYKHVSDIENKNLSIFHKNITWYEVVAEVLLRYQRDTSLSPSLNWEFWFLSVSVLDRLVTLSLDERTDNIKICSEYITTVFNFDQTLSKASLNIDSCPDRQLAQEFLNHYFGQLCFHLVTLVFKQAKKDLMKFKDASNITLPVLFAAYHTQPVDLQALWVSHTTESRRNLAQRWHKEASFRCSQVGHILLAAAKDRKSTIIDKASQYSTGNWREHLFKKVFITRDQQSKMNTSYFVVCTQLIEPTLKLPDTVDLLTYDAGAQLMYPDSLHHHIWIAMNHKLSDLPITAFEGLQYSVKNLNNCAAESLSVLDVQAFIYCATLCTQSQLAHAKNLVYYNSDQPLVLPAAITEQLGTNNQAKFISAASKLHKKDFCSDFGELRLLIIKGIEVVRCVGHHGLDAKLLVLLANIFEDRSKKSNKQSEIEFNDARAEMYWKTALPILEKLKNNQAVSYSPNRWFEYKSKEMSMNEILNHIEKGKLFSAVQLMKKKDFDKALQIFEGLRDPYASFYQAQIYKQMADQITSHSKENVTSEMRSQHIIVLSRARDCLYLTLDRLREPSVDRNHPLNSQLGTEIESIERQLSRIDPDCVNRNECDGMSDENVSSNDSAGDHYVTGFLHQSNYLSNTLPHRLDSHNIHSTPLHANLSRREARPSPERLDAQLRQLAASKDASINHILEHNKLMVESHKCLVEELRSFKDAVYNLTSTVDELKTIKHSFQELTDIKKSIDELKTSVDDLQSFKNVTDLVYEMKKEIAELRKDSTKQPNQLSDEDLCILDGEYAGDYNIGSQIPSAYNPALYPNYQGRLPAPGALPYGGLYPGMYSPMAAYAYGGLGLPQPGPLPFSPEQQIAAELRGISLSQVQLPGTYGQQNQALVQTLTQPVIPPTSLGISILGNNQPLVTQVSTQANLFQKSPLVTSTIATPSSIFQIATSTTSSSSIISNTLSNKAPPVNVVITTSDPLPSTLTPIPQKPLSVTIPPQHLKGNLPPKSQPHIYQIPMPVTSLSTASTPSVLSQPAPQASTHTLLSNVAPPVYSALAEKSPPKNLTLGLQINKSLDKTFNNSKADISDADKSNISVSSVEEQDPCPDFKPIIPLPEEVPLNTGEENEEVLFSERAKLFRHVVVHDTKEWKDRGVGVLKILRNDNTGKVRILMRRDQVHKICANHFLTKEMKLSQMPNNDRAYMWAAQDFADEQLVPETLCVRFKTPEEAKRFFDTFENAKKNLKDSGALKKLTKDDNSAPANTSKTEESKPLDLRYSAPSLGGFVFTSTPTFEPKPDPKIETKISSEKEPIKTSPFSAFTFGNKTQQSKTNLFANLQLTTVKSDSTSSLIATPEKVKSTSKSEIKAAESPDGADDSHTDDYEPNTEFKPVVPLPELVEVKTGEENADVLFECRAKLLRFDVCGQTKEWKERGIGVMKILKENTLRLVMRREQVHKVCCNHQVLKNMVFQKMSNNPKAVTWGAKDFSEGVVISETFALRFKEPEQADKFLKTITDVQATMNENSYIGGDKFAKADKHVKIDSASNKTDLNTSGSKTGFGDKFKIAKGSWECKTCYIVNEAKLNHCSACDSPKNNTIPPKTTISESSGMNFSFGVPLGSKEGFTPIKEPNKPSGLPTLPFSCLSNSVTITPIAKSTEKAGGFGDRFKPPEGSWECKICFVRNKSDLLYCVSCESPKDDTIPAKETSNRGVNLDTGGQKFTFGIPSAKASPAASSVGATAPKTTFTFGQPSTTVSAQFVFGAKTETPPFSFVKSVAPQSPATSIVQTTAPVANAAPVKESGGSGEKFIFGSPQKHDFGFTPKSPRRVSTGQGDEESDGSYVEEEADNIYFKPVIPLPEKVEIKTGEEQEEVLYCHRAKLFRYVSGEWKERGLGDIKILKNSDSARLRVVMRREQILKICLNHALTSDIDYLPKDEKTWLFSAPDFSEGEINHQQFCVRFKSAEVAQDFKKAVNDALSSATSDFSSVVGKQNETAGDDSDIEFVSETKVTSDEEKEAIKLGLPPKFMSYRQLPDCDCEQCQKDSVYLGEASHVVKPSKESLNVKTFKEGTVKPFEPSKPAKGSTSTNTASGNTSVFGSPFSNLSTPSSAGSVFGTPKEQSFSFISAPRKSTTTDSPKLKELLIKPPSLNVSKTEAEPIKSSPFSCVSFGTSTSTTKNIFSTPTTTTISGSLFGNKPTQSIFASPATETQTSNAFNKFSFTTTNPVASVTGTTTGNIFSTTSSIFNTAPSTGLFGSSTTSTTSTTTMTSSVFGSSTNSIFGTTANIFSTTDPSKASYSFGKPSGNVFGESSPIFGGGAVFGQSKDGNSATPLFGATPLTTSIFGGLSQHDQNKQNISAKDALQKNVPTFSLFAKDANQKDIPTFGSLAIDRQQKDVPTFGSLAKDTQQKDVPTFGSLSKDAQQKDIQTFDSLAKGKPSLAPVGSEVKQKGLSKAKDDEIVLKCDTNLSFASLAANTSEDAAPAFVKNTNGNVNPFAHLGAGTPVFASLKSKENRKSTSKANESVEGDEANDSTTGNAEEEYDPHFEPIVPLPATIVVSTGEENETAEYNERAKLYRYDDNTKEWKERGVGQMKILYHPLNKTYRFLLRREQVHKVVLNQLIVPDLEVQPMSTSDKAWMWAGYNHTEDGSSLEKLAIRFKNCDLAKQFFDKIQQVLEAVKDIQANKSLPSVVQDYGLEDVSADESGVQIQEIVNEDDDEEREEGDEDEDERSIMCMKTCILSEEDARRGWAQVTNGEIQIYYDPDLYAARILMNDPNSIMVSNTLIGVNTIMEMQGTDCVWKGVEWATSNLRWRKLKATFATEMDAQDFYYNYQEGLHYAQEFDVVDEIPPTNAEESED